MIPLESETKKEIEELFDDFEEVFLKQDVNKALLRGILNPFQWFSSTGRTEMAIKFYEEQVFQGATFADMKMNDAERGTPAVPTKSHWSKDALERLAKRVDKNVDKREAYDIKQKKRLDKMQDTFKRY